MKKLSALLLCSLLIISSCGKRIDDTTQVSEFGIVMHGGAGTITKKNMTPEREKEYTEKLTEALNAGYKILNNGGRSLDAVQTAINILEDSPLFNAGKGAVFNHDGKNEMDASIMDGKTLNSGAVAGVKHVKNPINLARLVMDSSRHVMMTGDGAEIFAVEKGMELVDESYFFTQKRFDYLQKVLEREQATPDSSQSNINLHKSEKYGTVGVAALDKDGNLAAGTSTGGLTNKRYGRVGDSPIIGAGTYANNKTCAVSATGTGEYFIRGVVTYDISALMEYKKMSIQEAADKVIQDKLIKLGGDGGVIGIDNKGNVMMSFNTEGMYRGYILSDGKAVIKIYKE
jgi:beta-aspartyl-peptidase (threonine type)